jgi:hypothetical protein
MRDLPPGDKEKILRRFFLQEASYLAQGGMLETDHHQRLADAWLAGCSALSSSQVASLRAAAPPEIAGDLMACP